jgi:hypothetical protein
MPSLVSSPGVALDAGTLHELYETLVPIADDLDRELRSTLESDWSVVDASFQIELPTALAGPAGKALRSLDLAWRLAFALTEREIDELDLAGSDEAYLDQIAPADEAGLLITSVEVGSVLAELKSKGSTTSRRLITAINILGALASISGAVNVQGFASAADADRAPRQVQVLDNRRESVADAIRHELPGVPPGFKVSITGTTPDGSQFTTTLVAPSDN